VEGLLAPFHLLQSYLAFPKTFEEKTTLRKQRLREVKYLPEVTQGQS
jgi:hypothetical protein